jgi:phosphohistidine phosphatase
MKKLLVLRHAKAEPDDGSVPDHERALTKKGVKTARRMGELLKEQQLVPDRVLSSTAERARTTAEAALEGLGASVPIDTLQELYLAEPPAYLAVLRRLGGDADAVLVVGHNPGIETLLFRLTHRTEHMPTAALAECHLSISAWSELDIETEAELANVWRPKEIDE